MYETGGENRDKRQNALIHLTGDGKRCCSFMWQINGREAHRSRRGATRKTRAGGVKEMASHRIGTESIEWKRRFGHPMCPWEKEYQKLQFVIWKWKKARKRQRQWERMHNLQLYIFAIRNRRPVESIERANTAPDASLILPRFVVIHAH